MDYLPVQVSDNQLSIINMKTSIIPKLDNAPRIENSYNSRDFTENKLENTSDSPYCSLKWRMGQLLVLPAGQQKQPYLPALDNTENLVQCLKHSPVSIVRLDPHLGEYRIKTWTQACAQAEKPVYLNISRLERHFQSPSNLSKPVQLVLEWMVALILLIALSPVFLCLVTVMQIYSPGEVFSPEWYVGKRGKIFQRLKLHIQNENNFLTWTLCKLGLDSIPQLINVLRGEISLFGHRGWSLEEVLEQNREFSQSKGFFGITSKWQIEPDTKVLHLDSQTL